MVLAVVALAGTLVHVDATVACPTELAVERELANLLPAGASDGGAAEPRHRFRLSDADGGLRVEVLGADSQPVAARTLPREGSCDGLAAAVAVVVAAWEAELDAGGVERFSLGPRPPSVPPAPSPVVVSEAAAPAVREPVHVSLGLGVVAAVAGGDLAPGARLEGRIAGGRQLGLTLALTHVGAHATSVGLLPEVGRWTRTLLAAGPSYRLGRGPATLDLHALAFGALLTTSGVDLPATRSDTTFQWGAGPGVRLGWTWRSALVWMGADGLIVPGHDRLMIAGLDARGTLPRLEVQLASGVSLSRYW